MSALSKIGKRGIPPVILYSLGIACEFSVVLIVFQLAFQLQMVFIRVAFLFAVCLDDLLYELSLASVGCFWRWMFAGVFCFADDIALWAPCASALSKDFINTFLLSILWSHIQF